ncbi:hydroxymethylglutaryl-CoA reductase, degradative [Salinisphaera sp. USBA-960]|nr:hydroxymethylglutaryl-CoA reductase, degradative [Salifodinibacter halophilus]NNC27129.1 hydroxymethylglutaryl-CoA reductase, degradative [Salifodinibacter halophilus]
MVCSRFPGFYKQSISDRLAALQASGVAVDADYQSLRAGQQVIDVAAADRLVENVIGVFGLPLGLGLNFIVNGRERVVPMVAEEPSIMAAVSSAARVARSSGGFTVEVGPRLLTGQIQVNDVPDPDAARTALEQNVEALVREANAVHPKMAARGGGARHLTVVEHRHTHYCGSMLVAHLAVDTRDAMGANLVNTMCEAIAPSIAELTGGAIGLRILSNLSDEALVRARVRLEPAQLASSNHTGEAVRDGVVRAGEFAEVDPHRAATHNKGIMNGVDAVAIATGNDWRAVEAAAHAYAARDGRYRALTRWTPDDGALVGELVMPMKVGTVGGQIESNPAVGIAHRILGVESAADLAGVMGAVGLAQNFAALRALATEGIQSGHMSLHARSVAAAANADDSIFEEVVARLIEGGEIKTWKAREIVDELTAGQGHNQGQVASQTPTSGTHDIAPHRIETAEAKGFGKIILLGEHSVVYGRRALAVPCPLKMRATATLQTGDFELSIPAWDAYARLGDPAPAIRSLHDSLALIAERLGVAGYGMHINVTPEFPRANGLGASAALAVAVIRAAAHCADVDMTDHAVSELAFECERIAHGTPSGIDNALAAFGESIVYQRDAAGGEPSIQALHVAESLPLVIGFTGVATSTAETVGAVRSAWQQHPARFDTIFDQIDELAGAGIDALATGDAAELGGLMNIDHGLLNALGVSSGPIEQIVAISREAGALGAKLTGGGGGGAVIALAADTTGRDHIAHAIRDAGFDAVETWLR